MSFAGVRTKFLGALLIQAVPSFSLLCAALIGTAWWTQDYKETVGVGQVVNGTVSLGLWQACHKTKSSVDESKACYLYDSNSTAHKSQISDIDVMRYSVTASVCLNGLSFMLASIACALFTVSRIVVLMIIAGISLVTSCILLIISLILSAQATVIWPQWIAVPAASPKDPAEFGWSFIVACVAAGIEGVGILVLFLFLMYLMMHRYAVSKDLSYPPARSDVFVQVADSEETKKHHQEILLARGDHASKVYTSIKLTRLQSGLDQNENPKEISDKTDITLIRALFLIVSLFLLGIQH